MMFERFNSGLILGISAILPVCIQAQPTAALGGRVASNSNRTKSVVVYSLADDKHSTADKKFIFQEIKGELPVVVCNSKPEVAAAINNYLYESLVADELDGVYGDEEIDESLVSPELESNSAPDSSTEEVNNTNLSISGEFDFYGVIGNRTLLGLTVFFLTEKVTGSVKNPVYVEERNHYMFDANTGEAISFELLTKLLSVTPEAMQQRISTAYSFAVDEALKQPCLVENTDMAGLLKLNQQLRKSDLLADEFVRSIPVYLRGNSLVFDRPVLPDAYKTCDPMGIVMEINAK